MSDREIENLIHAHLVDAGDFAGVGALLADAAFSGASGTMRGADAIERMLCARLIVHQDGVPRTKHLTTKCRDRNRRARRDGAVAVGLHCPAGCARRALQPIVSGRYADRFERRREGRWCFAERRVVSDLVGDVSQSAVCCFRANVR